MSRAIRIGGALLATSAALGLVVEDGGSRGARLLLEVALVAGVVVWGVGRIAGELGAIVRRRDEASMPSDAGAQVIELHAERAEGGAA